MKIPLSFSLKNRDSTTSKDARVLNGYVERTGKKGAVRTLKRPALDSAFELTSGTGQGLYVPNTPTGDGEPGVIINDVLTRAPTPKTKRLRFTVQPPNPTLNTAFSPSVQVSAIDSIGNVVTGFTSNITVALSTNPTSATLGGTLTQAAVSGVSTFNDLTLNRSGKDFTLRATSTGLTAVTSNAFTLSTSLVFTTQPTFAQTGATMSSVVVTARDSAGNTDTNYTGNVTVAIYTNPTGGPGTLSGTLTVTAVSGVATFSTLSIDTLGTYTLIATGTEVTTAYPPSGVVSDEFGIGMYFLGITADTSDYNVRTAFITAFGSIPTTAYTLQVKVFSGVVVSASATSAGALTWGTPWTGTPTFTLLNTGIIVGKGGVGGASGIVSAGTMQNGSAGSAGGKAMELSGQTVSITNADGSILGGGGGGGGGGGAQANFRDGGGGGTLIVTAVASGGGGGGGPGAGTMTGGAVVMNFLSTPVANQAFGDSEGSQLVDTLGTQTTAFGSVTVSALATAGGSSVFAGTTAAPGAAGVKTTITGTVSGSPDCGSAGGDGGAGASDFGAAGNAGGIGVITGIPDLNVATTGGAAGAAGKAINLTGGTANFVSGSGSPNVKGAVS